MKESMQANASGREDEVDRISNLPDPILHLILSRLQGTEVAIRTSIFSRRWRHLWTSLPSIDIDIARGQQHSQEFKSNEFKEFVSWVLANKSSLDLDSFRLRCLTYFKMSTIGTWIDAAVMRKVKLLDLIFRPSNLSDDIELPHSLVTCSSLEVLRLFLLGRALSLPKITAGLPALRVLELREVNLLDSNIVEYFLESCPLLEDLSLMDCKASSLVISCPKLKSLRIDAQISYLALFHECDSLKICCPKLEILKLLGYVAVEFLFESLYSLKEAVIHPKYFTSWEVPSFDLFARISHVEYLSINLSCIGRFFDPIVDAPLPLPNLKTLETTVDSLYALIPFLKCVPDLESLHLIIPKNIGRGYNLSLEEAETMRVLTRHLKKVEFLEFNEEDPILVVARALLEHGDLLEEMVFSWVDEAKFHERSMETMNQVSKFHKASSTVNLTCVFNPT